VKALLVTDSSRQRLLNLNSEQYSDQRIWAAQKTTSNTRSKPPSLIATIACSRTLGLAW
jgi:hypothetical protein